ncbi:hypothetical protein M8C21_026505, partial [Ambrosia artemisiifolia]
NAGRGQKYAVAMFCRVIYTSCLFITYALYSNLSRFETKAKEVWQLVDNMVQLGKATQLMRPRKKLVTL